jgi:hypothetical protein
MQFGVLFDDPGYELQIEDVARCCRARRVLDAVKDVIEEESVQDTLLDRWS